MVVLGYLMISSVSPSAELMALANGRDVPDTQFWRSASTFYQQIENYGVYGRRLYLTRVSPVDIFIPISQALFLSVMMTLVFRRAFAPQSRWQMLNVLPFVAMVGDYLENMSVVTMMLAYPTQLTELATASAVFTAVKFIFSLVSIGCIGVGLLLWLWRKGARR
ncbi:MAG: hypothetical protein H6665_05365 [Ardenticatenaceae bacterium]|nr:hypothetical protein [Ardenticatenaceae bacterium]